MKYINLGCGSKYSTESIWLNADMSPSSPEVVNCNFLNGIPYKDEEFDAVYHSHVIEHFSKKDAEFFIQECYRIINKNGTIRIACPNLEVIAREYLRNLERALNHEENGEEDYDWMMLEMYDQTVRNESGGDMLNYFRKEKVNNLDYISKRVGEVAKEWHKNLSGQKIPSPQKMETEKTNNGSLLNKLFSNKSDKNNNEAEIHQKIGEFRLGGEIHQWMYDRFSLKRLLENVGFKDVIVRTATDSYIPNWANFELDNPHENASIFIEAKKY